MYIYRSRSIVAFDGQMCLLAPTVLPPPCDIAPGTVAPTSKGMLDAILQAGAPYVVGVDGTRSKDNMIYIYISIFLYIYIDIHIWID